jgi:Flp pilus assembly protein TadG
MSDMWVINRQRGQGTVEFALVGPLLFIMLFAVMEGGWLMFHNHQISNGAREGARFAVVNGEMSGTNVDDLDDLIEARVRDRVSVSNPDALTVWYEAADPDLSENTPVQVNVEYTHETLVGFIFPGATINLSSSSTMRVHY